MKLPASTQTSLPSISIVVITYNRFKTLKPTIETLLDMLDYPREKLELIIADDGSNPDIIEQIEKLPHDTFVRTNGVKGFSANANRGLGAARHDVILQIQDDWQLMESGPFLRSAVDVLLQNPDIGMLLLNQSPNNVSFDTRYIAGHEIRVFHNRPDVLVRNVCEHAYSDWPHIKCRAFVDAIGAYNEKLPMWDNELDYSRRINAQTRYRVADIVGLTALTHIGADLSYNTGSRITRIKGVLLKIPVLRKLLEWMNLKRRG